MAIELDPDFKEFLSLLERHDVEYLLIGGYAVNYYGYVRYTGDIDIFVSSSPENAARVTSVMHEFGFTEVTAEMVTTPSSMLRVGIKPTQLEVTNFIDGVSFDECWVSRSRVKIDDLELNVISLEKLRKNKLASGRTKDLADLENLPEQEG
jgi:predicted nucleotidyltransferase